MATQAERLEALEKENGELKISVGVLTDELAKAVEKLSDFETLTERVEKLELDGMPGGGELIAAELVEGYDPRGDLLKALRQIEAIANHINVRLPA